MDAVKLTEKPEEKQWKTTIAAPDVALSTGV
jgi:hypothetical protein